MLLGWRPSLVGWRPSLLGEANARKVMLARPAGLPLGKRLRPANGTTETEEEHEVISFQSSESYD